MIGGVYPGEALVGGTIFAPSGPGPASLSAVLASSRSSATAFITGGPLGAAPSMTYPTGLTIVLARPTIAPLGMADGGAPGTVFTDAYDGGTPTGGFTNALDGGTPASVVPSLTYPTTLSLAQGSTTLALVFSSTTLMILA